MVIIIVLFVLISVATPSSKHVFTDKEYHVSLQYPSTWILKTAYYSPRYEGTDGFFEISALDGEGWTIDQAAENDANHILKPFGTTPLISDFKVQGQEARIIMPSDDQPIGMKDTAELIVKSPVKIQINGDSYYFLILCADKYHIKQIAKTVKFIY